jgi:predicted HicB family RNase H-like nuclease
MRDKDKYLKIVEWSSEDNCYVGLIPGWIGKCCHGDDEFKVYQELAKILDEWIDIYKNDKRPLPHPHPILKKYSGKFVLRTGSELHKALSLKALNEGESLNKFLLKRLRSIVSE